MNKIIGENPISHERIHQFLYASSRQAPGGIAQQAIAAIENALLDIKGKKLNVPVHTLLGGAVRNKLELYWSHCGTYRISEELSKIATVHAEIPMRGVKQSLNVSVATGVAGYEFSKIYTSLRK